MIWQKIIKASSAATAAPGDVKAPGVAEETFNKRVITHNGSWPWNGFGQHINSRPKQLARSRFNTETTFIFKMQISFEYKPEQEQRLPYGNASFLRNLPGKNA